MMTELLCPGWHQGTGLRMCGAQICRAACVDKSSWIGVCSAGFIVQEESRAQHAKYQQKLSRATQAGMC